MSALFRNNQWQVTTHGLEPVNVMVGSLIPCDELLKLRAGESLYEWPLHMAEKTWIDYSAFEQAFRMALERHTTGGQLDPVRLDLSIRKGRDIARRIQLHRAEKTSV